MSSLIGSLRVDSPGLVILELGLWLLFGSYCLVAGVADLTQRQLPWRLWGDRPLRVDRYVRLLRSWQIMGTGDADFSLPARIGRAWQQVGSYKAIVFGISSWLAVVGYVSTALMQQYVAPPDARVLFFGLMLAFVSGQLVGEVVGSARLRARPGRAVAAYGDPRPRRLRDYRSPLFLACSMTFAVLQVVLTLVAAPLTAERAVYPLVSLSVVAVTELILRFVTREPRLPLLADPVQARRLDDMLRSETLKGIQVSGLYAIGYLGGLQGLLLGQIAGTNGWVIALWSTFVGCYMLGAVTYMYLLGWMGGTVTGWRWEKGSRAHGSATARP